MKDIRNDYCIRMFTRFDKLKPAMGKVNFDNGCLYASDGCIMSKINSALCVKAYKHIEDFPNCEAVLLTHKQSESKIFSINKLFNELMKIECFFKPNMVVCEDCNGEGEIVCSECGHEHECEGCRGTGELPGDKIELVSKDECVLFERKYQVKYIDMIIRTAIFTNVENIEISNGHNENCGTMFYVGDFTIFLMPTL